MWAFALRYRAAHLNEMVIPWRVRGSLQPAALEQALTDLVRRHPTLRARLAYRQGRLDIEVMPVEPVALQHLTVEAQTLDARLSTAIKEVTSPTRQHIDILAGPTLIARLLRLGEDDHVLSLAVHHAMCDGWSIGIMVRDLAAFYAARLAGVACDLAPLPEQYTDVARREAEVYTSGGFSEEIAYWRTTLAGLPPPLALPTVAPRKGNRDWRSGETSIRRPAEFMTRLREVAKKQRISLFALLVAALAVVLRQRTGREDLLIGVPTLNRWTEESLQFVGYATSMLPLRVLPASGLAFNALAKQINVSVREMLAYGRVPLEVLLRETPLAPLGNNVFPVWCQYLEGQADAVAVPSWGDGVGPSFELLATERNSLLAEMDVDLTGDDTGWRCVLAYRQALFSTPMIDGLMADYLGTLDKVLDDAASPIDGLVAQLESTAGSASASAD